MELLTNKQWQQRLTFRGDGTYTYERQRRPTGGATEPERVTEQYRLTESGLKDLISRLEATQWLAVAGKVQPRLKDGTRYVMSVERAGRTADTVCYGDDQDISYSDRLRLVDNFCQQESRVLELKRGCAQHLTVPTATGATRRRMQNWASPTRARTRRSRLGPWPGDSPGQQVQQDAFGHGVVGLALQIDMVAEAKLAQEDLASLQRDAQHCGVLRVG